MKIKFGITGGTGSLGKTLIRQNPNLQFFQFKGDIRNRSKIKKWIINNNFDAIIHLAAIVPIKTVNQNKKKAYKVNYNGTKHVVDAIVKSKIKWFFFASTSHVYKSCKKRITESFPKKPISYYGKTKLLAEKYISKNLIKSQTKYCIGRIFSTSNINQKKNYLVPDLINKTKNAKNHLVFKNLNHYRDFISMTDISKIIILLYKKNFQGKINIGRGKGVLLKDIAKVISKKFKKKFKFNDNKKITYLVANNDKLKRYFKFSNNMKLEKIIF